MSVNERGLPGAKPKDNAKNTWTVQLPEGAEKDPAFQKMIQEVDPNHEGGRALPGWLHGRGAFDSTDMLHLREIEDTKKQTLAFVETMEEQALAAFKAASERENMQKLPKLATATRKDSTPQSQMVKKVLMVKKKLPGKAEKSNTSSNQHSTSGKSQATSSEHGSDPEQPAAKKAKANGEGGKVDREEANSPPAGLLGLVSYGSGSDDDE